jgi:hypothetical protein
MNVRSEEEPFDLGDPDSWPKSQYGFKDLINAIKQRLFPTKSWEVTVREKTEVEPQADLS